VWPPPQRDAPAPASSILRLPPHWKIPASRHAVPPTPASARPHDAPPVPASPKETLPKGDTWRRPCRAGESGESAPPTPRLACDPGATGRTVGLCAWAPNGRMARALRRDPTPSVGEMQRRSVPEVPVHTLDGPVLDGGCRGERAGESLSSCGSVQVERFAYQTSSDVLSTVSGQGRTSCVSRQRGEVIPPGSETSARCASGEQLCLLLIGVCGCECHPLGISEVVITGGSQLPCSTSIPRETRRIVQCCGFAV